MSRNKVNLIGHNLTTFSIRLIPPFLSPFQTLPMEDDGEPQPGPSGLASQDKVLEYSILDIPGISYGETMEQDDADEAEENETLVRTVMVNTHGV